MSEYYTEKHPRTFDASILFSPDGTELGAIWNCEVDTALKWLNSETSQLRDELKAKNKRIAELEAEITNTQNIAYKLYQFVLHASKTLSCDFALLRLDAANLVVMPEYDIAKSVADKISDNLVVMPEYDIAKSVADKISELEQENALLKEHIGAEPTTADDLNENITFWQCPECDVLYQDASDAHVCTSCGYSEDES